MKIRRRKSTTALLPTSSLPPRVFSWLALALTIVTLPHLAHLPPWLVVLLAVAILWRWTIAKHQKILPPRWLLVMLTLAMVIAVGFTQRTLLGRDAGVALLVAMTAMKCLESRSQRDLTVLMTLAYLLLMTNLLYSQSIAMAAYLLSILTVLIATHMMLRPEHINMPTSYPLRLGLRMLLQSIPVMLILFVLFPRIPGPIWSLPQDAHKGRSGLSDEMTPGDISNLILSDDVAFRVRFDDNVPDNSQLYWRGPVLDHYDGRTWRTKPSLVRNQIPPLKGEQEVDYTIILEPHGKHWLFALDLPASLPNRTGITHAFQLRRRDPIHQVIRYPMRSWLRYQTQGRVPSFRHRHLPPRINPQARRLAADWKQQLNPADRVRTALTLFREQPFHYTLSPPRLQGRDSIDQFLFNTRRGFCEHYAGSFVFLMRAAGIPARVVTGYLGGEYNEVADYFIVRQSDAHAWAEVWLQEAGWVRIDPTAAVSPQRVEQGIHAAVDTPSDLPFMARRENPWLRELALNWDSVNNAWNEWVLAYGPERQKEFLSGLGFGPIDWRGMVTAMVTALAMLGAIFFGFWLWQRRRRIDPVARAYERFCAKLGRRGVIRRPSEGPLDFAARASSQHPKLEAHIRSIANLYSDLRYGREHRAESVLQLQHLVKTL